MAETLHFELVSPERKLVSTAATQVQIPGAAGDFTAMPKHAPFLTTLRPGVVRVVGEKGVEEFVVTGGFAEVSPTTATILAELAVPKGEGDRDMIASLVARAEAAQAQATPEGRQAADQFLRDAKQLASQLGA
jgi:F-type H+-transporting ATPase subunit epsilon